MSDIALAEQLWTRAHEHVKRGEFADAVRDLAQAFQILQAANDPRLYEVHRRWTEVHQMYLEDGARAQQAQQAQQTPSLEAEAEAAVNAGELEKAIGLYQRAVAEKPTHELARERLQELLQARARAHELVNGRSEPVAAHPAVVTTPPSSEASATLVPATTSEDDWSDIAVDDSGPATAAPASTAGAPEIEREVSVSMIESSVEVSAEIGAEVNAGSAELGFDVKFSDEMSFADLNDAQPATATSTSPQEAPAMAPEDAPIGMQSLDVPFSVGAAISEEGADELPVEGAPSLAPVAAATSIAALAPIDGPASTSPQDQIAFLNELLVRVAKHRRRVA